MSGANILSFPYWAAGGSSQPDSMSLTGWWRDYDPALPWNGAPSIGTSGAADRYLTTSGTPEQDPGYGTALNGHGTARFNGGKKLNAAVSFDSYANATSVSGWALLSPITATGGDIIRDSTSSFVVSMSVGAVNFAVSTGGIGTVTVTRALSSSVYSLVTWKYNGVTVNVGVNEIPGSAGGGSTASATIPMTLTGAVTVGTTMDASLAELAMSDTVLADADFTNIKAYVNARYALSL